MNGNDSESAIGGIISRSCIRNNGSGLCSSSDLETVSNNIGRVRRYQNKVFGTLETSGGIALVSRGVLTATGIGSPLGATLITYGGITSNVGAIGSGIIDYSKNKNSDNLIRTFVIGGISVSHGRYLKFLKINGVNRELLQGYFDIGLNVFENIYENR